MPDQLEDIPAILLWIVAAGTVALALYNLGRLAAAVRLPQLGRWVAGVLWIAFGPLVTAAMRVVVREAVREETRAILDELRPNGGSSLRDAVDRTERKMDEHLAWSRQIIDLNRLHEPDR